MTPTKTNVCLTCQHPQVAEIDAALAANAPLARRLRRSFAEISEPFGLDYQTVSRHWRRGHVTPQETVAAGGTDDHANRADEDPHDVLRRVMRELSGPSMDGLSGHAKIARLDAIRRVASDLAKTMPPPQPKTVAFGDVAGLPELFATIVEVLEPYPRVRAELANALRARGLEEVLG